MEPIVTYITTHFSILAFSFSIFTKFEIYVLKKPKSDVNS